MAEITLNIPNGHLKRIKDALAEHYDGYDDVDIDLSSNELVLEELKKIVMRDIKSFIKNKERQKAIKGITVEEFNID